MQRRLALHTYTIRKIDYQLLKSSTDWLLSTDLDYHKLGPTIESYDDDDYDNNINSNKKFKGAPFTTPKDQSDMLLHVTVNTGTRFQYFTY